MQLECLTNEALRIDCTMNYVQIFEQRNDRSEDVLNFCTKSRFDRKTTDSREIPANSWRLKNLMRGTFSAQQTALLILFCPREKLETPLFPRTLNSSSKCVASHSFRNKNLSLTHQSGRKTCEWENCFPRLMTHRRRLVRSLMH